MAVHGNQPEALRDLMLAWMRRHPLGPLEDERVLVQSNGVAQWLKLSLARDPADGGIGIAAALRTELPSRFFWQAYRAVLGHDAVPEGSPFDSESLVWRLMRLLPSLLAEPVFAPLARFLADDGDMRKRHQLARRLADLFDQYQVYRADWLAAWASGANVIIASRTGRSAVPADLAWQPRLWRALLEDVGAAQAHSSRASVHRRFLDRAGGWQGPPPEGLPRRLIVFGISSLPQQAIEVVGVLSRWVQVVMCVHNPCEHNWSHVVADKDLLRAGQRRQRRRPGSEHEIPDEQLHMHAQPLLAAWGKQGRDFIRLLDQHDEAQRHAKRFAAIGERMDFFTPTGGATLLHQLQDDILALRPLHESRDAWPAVDLNRDASMRFHVVHSPQREVEVLHDQLLAAFAADPTLGVRDVIVMVPDIAGYAPHVQAVFGRLPVHDPRHIPFHLVDRSQRHQDPLLVALESLLSLPESRLAASEVMDWLEVPALRARFGIKESDLPLLQRWIADANVRWGLHAEHRECLGLPGGFEQNSWHFGLQRMLLGYAVGGGDAWAGIEPLDEIGGLDAAVLGPLADLLQAVETLWRALSTPAAPATWGVRLRALLQDFFEAGDEADGYTLLHLESTLEGWLATCAAAGMHEAMPLSVVREAWLERIDAGGLEQSFFSGAVTFATLLPMRAIPFRVVALLGMNDGDYPRSRTGMDFDLMRGDYRPGDRSRREDDRYLFLEALLSARDRLHVSWVGRSIRDQSERPPSVLVAQLRDHLAAGWRLPGDESLPAARAGERLLDALTLTHRSQPFDVAYFEQGGDPRHFSYAHEWRDVSSGGGAGKAAEPAALAPWAFEGPLKLAVLGNFVRDPVGQFLRQRLRVDLDLRLEASADHEPFALDALENWQLQHELVQAQSAALDDGRGRQDALEAGLARIAGRGDLPVGHFSSFRQEELAKPMEKMFEQYRDALAAWPHVLPDTIVEDEWEGNRESDDESTCGSVRLEDSLDRLRGNDQGERCRILLDSTGVVKAGRYRLDRLLVPWVAHLAGHLGGEALSTRIVSKAGEATLKPLAPDQARIHLRELIDAWQQGMRAPLPFAPKSALAWVHAGGLSGDADALPKARRAARNAYEVSNARFGQRAERDDAPALARAFPDFDALWSDGAFETWVRILMGPLAAAVAHAGDAKAGGNARTGTGGAEAAGGKA